jgi:fructose 5-dehydrogenase small subunit
MKLLSGASRDASFRPGRRGFVLSAAALAALALVEPQARVLAAGAELAGSAFMIVSRLVTGDALDPRTAQALYSALNRKAGFAQNLETLAKIASAPRMTVETLAAHLDATHQTALRDTLNQIVSAWYLGIVDNKTYAYRGALMYRPTADVLSPPSYVRAGPLNWANSHPPADGF